MKNYKITIKVNMVLADKDYEKKKKEIFDKIWQTINKIKIRGAIVWVMGEDK